MTLELTTRFRGISTSSKSTDKRNSGGKSPSQAVGQAMANLRYITRESALADAAWFGKPVLDTMREFDQDTPDSSQRAAMHATLRKALTERAQEGGKEGRMVATRVTISLPNSWPEHAQDAALMHLGRHFAPADSEAIAIGAIHRDKPNNRHIHFLVADGRESELAALNRRVHEVGKGGATPKRIRRRNVNRFNADLGRPKEIRREIAEILNQIADRDGLERIESKSFKERGIERTPDKHRGPAADAQEKATVRMQEAGRQWFDGGECLSIDRSPPKAREIEQPATMPPVNIPQPATMPPAPAPAGRKVLVKGRWITLPPGQDAPKPKRKKMGDDAR